MNIAIVGAGIVGVTTAYELARDGHSVTVFEQRSATAEEASFATGGLLAPGILAPWSAPAQRDSPPFLVAPPRCAWAARCRPPIWPGCTAGAAQRGATPAAPCRSHRCWPWSAWHATATRACKR